MAWSAPLLRALGADPEVFRPVYRVQKLLLSRRARLVQRRRRQSAALAIPPFFLLCTMACLWGLLAIGIVLSGPPAEGAGFALTVGGTFLLMVILTDNADALVHPTEYLVLAAHPHDDRSLLLAKLAALGRSLGLLSGLLFLPSGLVLLFFRSPAAGAGFLLGAVGLAIAIATGGLLLAVLLVRLWGRETMERLLSWVQGAFWIVYLALSSQDRLTQSLPPRALLALPWLLPPFWFSSPLELATVGVSAQALGRLALAAGSLVLLVFAFGRLAVGLSTRLLEPEPRRAARPSAAALPERRRSSLLLGPEGFRLLTLIRFQLRTDWRARSEMLFTPLFSLYLLYRLLRGSDPAGGAMVIFLFGWLLMLSTDTLTRSFRPATLWWLLVGPLDRVRFSLSTVALLRLFLLLPVTLALFLCGLRAPLPWPDRLALYAELALYGDLLLLAGKGFFPPFPFSLPSRREGSGSGARFLAAVTSSLLSGAGVGLIALSRRFGTRGVLLGALLFLLLHPPVALWARRRTARAAAELEITELE